MIRAASCTLACGCLLVACGDGDAVPVPHRAAPFVASANCRLKTPQAWQDFLEAAADSPAWVKTCSDLGDCESMTGSFALHVRDDILPVLAECSVDLAKNTQLSACVTNLRQFAPAWLRQHSGTSYGFERDNPEYFAAQLASDLPSGMMEPPAALLAALPEHAALEQVARQQGWAYLTHASCLTGVRTFFHVVDPDDRFEQWLLIGVYEEEAKLRVGDVVSFIAVQKRAANGAVLDAVRLHFRDYAVARSNDTWRLELPPGGSGKCYACHGSGVRQLLPDLADITRSAAVLGEPAYDAPRPPAELTARRLAEFNARLTSYGLPDWSGTIRPENYGPALGSTLGCTQCHDGRQRGPLTVFTSEGMLHQKVVEQLSMRSFTGHEPVPDVPAMQLLQRERQDPDSLSADEQQALANARAEHERDFSALMSSRRPELEAWLLATRCDTPGD